MVLKAGLHFEMLLRQGSVVVVIGSVGGTAKLFKIKTKSKRAKLV